MCGDGCDLLPARHAFGQRGCRMGPTPEDAAKHENENDNAETRMRLKESEPVRFWQIVRGEASVKHQKHKNHNGPVEGFGDAAVRLLHLLILNCLSERESRSPWLFIQV